MRNITREFNDIGEKITIQLSYKDMEVSKLPKSCMSCPVGFMSNNCGREYPMGEFRPDTCKLKLTDIEEKLDMREKVKEYISELDVEIDRCEQEVVNHSASKIDYMRYMVRLETLVQVQSDLRNRLEELV